MKSRILLVVALYISIIPHAVSESVHWDYGDSEGPENWGKLAVDFDMCARGQNQSPIDLEADIDVDLPELDFEYENIGFLQEVNTGHAIQENVSPNNYLHVKGIKFELKQFHFHSPSEHTVGGEYYPMELHLVHQNSEGKYAVVGLLFQAGEPNELMNQLPSFKAARGVDPHSNPVDINDLIRERENYFQYNGSLTTPPCTEGVFWIVLKQPIIASSDQIQHYHDLLGFDNNRPVQPHNARGILE